MRRLIIITPALLRRWQRILNVDAYSLGTLFLLDPLFRLVENMKYENLSSKNKDRISQNTKKRNCITHSRSNYGEPLFLVENK